MSKNAYLFSLQFPASECKWKLQGNSQNVVGFYRQSGNFRSPKGVNLRELPTKKRHFAPIFHGCRFANR